MISRRLFVNGAALVAVGSAGFLPKLARAAIPGAALLTGNQFDLSLSEMPVNITGRKAIANVVNGLTPGPVLRFREGETVTINVTNRLKASSSIHWHGLRVAADMDGAPGLSFRGIPPGEAFTYRYPVKQSGAYWYHSYSGMPEQMGLHGALIIDPKGPEAHPADRVAFVDTLHNTRWGDRCLRPKMTFRAGEAWENLGGRQFPDPGVKAPGRCEDFLSHGPSRCAWPSHLRRAKHNDNFARSQP